MMKKKTKEEMEEIVASEKEDISGDVREKLEAETTNEEKTTEEELDLGLDNSEVEEPSKEEEQPSLTTINKTEYLTEVKPEFKEVAEMFFSLDSISDPEELKSKITETQASFENYLQTQFVPKIVKSLEMKQQGAVKQGISGAPQEPERKRITTPRRNLR